MQALHHDLSMARHRVRDLLDPVLDQDAATKAYVDGLVGGDGLFTPGAVIFAGADGLLAEDPTQFFWDNPNNRLGIQTNSPQDALHLGAGSIRIDSLTASRLTATDANKSLTSVSDLTNWIAGTTNRITSTSDGDGTLTLDISSSYVGQTSITTLGTIATGVWQGTAVGPTYGGTNQTSWTTGDLLYASASNTLAKRAIGSSGDVLTVSSGVPAWASLSSLSIVTGTGAANRIAYWSGTNALTSDADVTFDGTTFKIVSASADSEAFSVQRAGDTTQYLTMMFGANGNDIVTRSATTNAKPLRFHSTTNATHDAPSSGFNYFEFLLRNSAMLRLGQVATTMANGTYARFLATTFTDTATAASGTVASAFGIRLEAPTFAATNASVTTTDAATLYIAANPTAGTNQTFTNSYAVWVDAGNVRFDGQALLPTTGSSGGIVIGGDVHVYRSAADLLYTPDSVRLDGRLSIGGTASETTSIYVVAAGGSRGLTLRTTSGSNNAPMIIWDDAFTPYSTTIRFAMRQSANQFVIANFPDGGSFTNLLTLSSSGVIGTATWQGQTIQPGYGGTGLTSYAVGDLLYASASTTLAKLAAVATGNVLLSGGVATAPSWGKAVLGTHTSGNYVSTIAGTTNRLTASASTGDVVLDISSSYVGQTSITTLGTIATGTWNGTAVGPTYGGTDQTSWATGDILYASASNTLAKRTIGSSGDVLTVSGGVPAWASLSSLSIVSGTGSSGQVTYWSGTNAITGNAAFTFTAASGQLALSTTGSGAGLLLGGDALLYRSAADVLRTPDSLTIDGTLTAGTYVGQTSITTLGTIATGTWNGTAVGVAYGGTAIASYTAGDLLYATGATTLAKLGIGATGTILSSSGSAPQWSTLSSMSIPTGTGTSNYVVKWTGTNTQGNSLLRDDGTSVSIGATPAVNALFLTSVTYTNHASSSLYAQYNTVVGAHSDATTRTYYGVTGVATVQLSENAAAAAYAINGTTESSYVATGKTNTGSWAGVQGYGVINSASHLGVQSNLHGVIAYSGFGSSAGSGTVTTLYGARIILLRSSAAASVTGNYFGLHIGESGSSSSIATRYGIYENLTAGAINRFGNRITVSAAQADLGNIGIDYNGTWTATTNGAYGQIGIRIGPGASVDTGVTNSTYWLGLYSNMRPGAGHLGTVAAQYGAWLDYGFASSSGSGTITNAFGLNIGLHRSAAGTIGSAFGVRITETGSTTTVSGTRWGFYEALSSGAFNYFANTVGIGTTGPDRKLDVLDTSGPQLRLTYTDGSVFTDFETTSAGYFRINPSGGRFAIGSHSPAGAFHFVGSSGVALFADSNTDATIKQSRIGITAYNTAQSPLYALYLNAGLSSNVVNIGGGTSAGQAATLVDVYAASAVNTTTGTLLARFSGSSNFVGIAAGNVFGVGTTSPSSSTLGTFTRTLTDQTGTTYGLYVTSTNIAAAANVGGHPAVAVGFLNTRAASGYSLGAHSAFRAYSYINHSGHAGTIAELNGLYAETGLGSSATGSGTVTSAHGVYAILVRSGTGTIGNYYGLRIAESGSTTTISGGRWGVYENLATGAVNYFRNNVGINTTGPSQALHVAGSVRVTGGYYDSANSVGTSSQVLTGGATATWQSLSSLSIPTGTGTSTHVAYWSGTNTLTGGAAFTFTAGTGQLALSTTGSGAGILIGGDALLYRSAADVLRTPDSLTVDGTFTAGTYVGQTSITTLGTIGTGVWQGTAVGPTYGGTNQTSWTTGDLLYASNTNVLSKLAIGTNGHFLKVASGLPSWSALALSDLSAFTSADLAGKVSDETGTGALVFASSPVLSSPEIGGSPTDAASTTGAESDVLMSNSTGELYYTDVPIEIKWGTFTPTATGADTEIVAVFDSSLTLSYRLVKFIVRVETASAGTSTLQLEKYSGTGAFSGTNVLSSSLSISGGSTYEASTTSFAVTTLSGGDKLRLNFSALSGSHANFTVWLVMRRMPDEP